MKNKPLLSWAKHWHYPQLVVAPGDVIRAGPASWKLFVLGADATRMDLAWQRVGLWNERAGVDQPPEEIIDELIS